MTEQRLATASPAAPSAEARQIEYGEATLAGGRGRGLVVAVIASALLAAIGWRFSDLSGACRPNALDGGGRSAEVRLGQTRGISATGGGRARQKVQLNATGARHGLDRNLHEQRRA